MVASAFAEQLTLPLEHRVAHGVEDLLVTPGNRHAVEWIDRWPDWPFTALIVVGPAASGKTHLAALWKARADAARVTLGDTDIENAATVAASRSILIDDCDEAVHAGDRQRALLHYYNLARTAGRQLMLTAKSPPSEWRVELADLSSRLNSAMVVAIEPPDDQTLAAVALKLFSDRQVAVDQSVISYVLSRGERSFAGVATAVRALDQAALAAKRPITVALARDVLAALSGLAGDGDA
jgi:DnaA regulatory inactivator Hda